MTLKKAVELMRGDRGKSILLTILRKGATQPLKIKVTRDIILVKSIKSKILDKNYGYIRISQFQTHSGEDLIAAITQLKKDTNNNLKGIILDLRNNPGGILESSVKVSDAFLDKSKLKYNGMIVYTEGRLPGSEIKEYSHDGDVLNGAPIVALVNGGSASASEIVAGALQDHKRAIIVGTQTFGKGSVQTVLPLKDNYGLKLTTALYFTPSGRSIQAKGITPDIEIPDIKIPEKKESEEDSLLNIREADLEGHLNNATQSAKTPDKDKAEKTDTPDNKPLLNQDYQLNEALNLLKGLAFNNPENAKETASSTSMQKAKAVASDTD
jgi:carboxyl-terminal processing protease